MSSSRLPWRIAFPFAAFVLAGSVTLALWMSWMSVRAERTRMETLARSSADLIQRMRLPPSERMALELSEVLHVNVMFQQENRFVPAALVSDHPDAASAILSLPPTGKLVAGIRSLHDVVKLPLPDGWNLVLWSPRLRPWSGLLEVQTLLALAAFWAMALLLALSVVRGLVRPLRHLAARLPDIEKPGSIELPEAARQDEIGDVARAFMRTRAALNTERTQREQAEKLAVLGRMTAALAHEIQNPVAAIKMHAQLAAMDGNHPSANIIASEAGRIESLVNQWMFLSKPEPPAVRPVDVAALLAQTLEAHRAQLDHAEVTASLHAPEFLMVMGDGKRLQQVFSNLVMNAIQAMPAGGEIEVVATSATAAVEVLVSDRGHGFSTEALQRCAEFFFSEKEGGMGIGLSVATEIVKAHGGTLVAANRGQSGAVVTVRLPASFTS